MSRPALDGLRVLEVAESLSASYCAKLLSDQGADVIKLESADGDPLRWWSASQPDAPADRTQPLFRFLNASKRSVTPDRVDPVELFSWAQVLITGPRRDGLDARAAEWLGQEPGAVQVDLSPFGRSGPLVGLPATEFTLQGWSGAISARGSADRPPLHQGGSVGDWLTGALGALAALAGLRRLDAVGRGSQVEVSALEAMAVCLVTYPTLYRDFTGAAAAISQRGSDYPSVERCRDGWVGLCVFTAQQWADFSVMIGRPELAEDQRLSSMAARGANREYAISVIQPWLEEHTADEIFELGGLFRVPVAYIGNGRSLPEMEHFAERGTYGPHPGEGFLQPRPPFRMTATPVRPAGSAPEPGEHNSSVGGPGGLGGARPAASPRPAPPHNPPVGAHGPTGPRDAGYRPLAGVKILDFTAFWAGPAGTHVLVALGAEVIKIESSKRPDGIRFATVARPDQPDWLERSPIFQGTNPGKLSVGIDLTTPRGRELARALAKRCDSVWENFTPRVMENLGLDYETLRDGHEQLIMVRIPGFGLDGPWRDHSGFAQTMEQVSGMAWLTGYPDRNPLVRTTCDPVTGIHAAFAFLAALRHRDQTGEGQLIEVAMADVAVNVTAEQVIEHSATGTLLERDANRGPGGAPQGVYPCRDPEHWVALAVTDDATWARLVDLMGRPSWCAGDALARAAGRRARADFLDERLATWTAGLDRDDLVRRLTEAGIPAAPVWPQTMLDTQAQLQARSFFQPVEHPSIGTVAYPGIGLTSRDLTTTYRAPAPMLGEHTARVLTAELGLGPEELDELSRAGIIDVGMPASS